MNVPDDRARRKALRLELVGRRQAMDAATLAPLHAALETRVEALLTQLRPASVGFTWPYRGEFDALPLMRRWLAADPARWAALPVVGEKGQPMTFRRWAPDTVMATDRYGIPYPADGEAVVPALLLIPATASTAGATGWAMAPATMTARWPRWCRHRWRWAWPSRTAGWTTCSHSRMTCRWTGS